MAKHRIDKIDRIILSSLQEDGRITNVDLAEKAGISAPPCLRRVRALEDLGYIESYQANLNRTMLGFGVSVFASVALEDTSEKSLQAFIVSTQSMDYVRECYMLAGDMDFLIKIVAPDWDTYQRFVTEELTALNNVRSVKSSLIMRRTFKKPGVPISAD